MNGGNRQANVAAGLVRRAENTVLVRRAEQAPRLNQAAAIRRRCARSSDQRLFEAQFFGLWQFVDVAETE